MNFDDHLNECASSKDYNDDRDEGEDGGRGSSDCISIENSIVHLAPPPPTIHQYLMNRELGLGAGPHGARLRNSCTGTVRGEIGHDQRQLYTRLAPHRALHMTDVSMTSVKRFSPSGEHLVCFSPCQRSLQVFRVDYYCCHPDQPPSSFFDFFTLLYEVPITGGVELLCRDFLLFTTTSKQQPYLILASATPATANADPPEPSPQANPHSLDCLGSLDHVTFYLVRLADGRITDRLRFPSDYIFLAHHAGVSLCGPWLAITSVQHQLVRVYRIDYSSSEAKFVLSAQIGHTLYLDDQLSMRRAGLIHDDPPDHHPQLLGIRHRLMAWLYRSALRQEDPWGSIHLLYLDWARLSRLCIWKAQFLDPAHLFLKLGGSEQLAGRQFDAVPSVVFFLIYHLPTTRILAVYSGDDYGLYRLLTEHQESFRILPSHDPLDGHHHHHHCNYSTHPGVSLEEDYLWTRQFDILLSSSRAANNANTNSCYHFAATAIRRLLANLPHSPQVGGGELGGGVSPYLDTTLFRWDERVVGAGDRAKPSSEYAVRFFRRRDRRIAFRLDPTGTTDHHHALVTSIGQQRLK